ncbi:23S rRNA (guanosine(2251)-2'-O)-methyltransferase RlmB [Desulfuromonas thiophila]|uniref:23S rRNA (guanosine(2251)-2'-O)-methyltransferase RlmB n=1 Tax=Desulfuromonas thiophila TaxID=57664 RepID=UPI0024A7CB77|nr:23S rRNA (guanosine(2251)-2'-O)-methyltransferase RlmB [Desulfuromonas thiophila]
MSDDQLLYGINPVQAALQQAGRVKELLLVESELSERLSQLAVQAQQSSVRLRRLPRAELDRLCGGDRHQGVVARVAAVQTQRLEALLAQLRQPTALVLVLDGVTDPHNFGALIRSAAAAGCQAVVYGRDRSCPLTATVARAAAGCLERVALCPVVNLSRALRQLKEAGLWVYGLAGEQAASLYATDLAGPVALVVGAEGKGLRPAVRSECDQLLCIPMAAAVESLNVSVAAAVALFEVVRQRVAAGGRQEK